ncbi:MAG: hypothetical protein IJ955_06855 [Oscillospiraceae bacterium]|nr:hypothetical protein [Oscillospiraceae bacterium]
MEYYDAKYNCRVRITCGGVPFDQIPKPYIPPQHMIDALGRQLATKYAAKDAKWPDEVE